MNSMTRPEPGEWPHVKTPSLNWAPGPDGEGFVDSVTEEEGGRRSADQEEDCQRSRPSCVTRVAGDSASVSSSGQELIVVPTWWGVEEVKELTHVEV